MQIGTLLNRYVRTLQYGNLQNFPATCILRESAILTIGVLNIPN